MAKVITHTLNKALRDGMHADIAEAVLAAIYKGKGDRADPSLYRGIAMQNLVPKILATLLAARLSHWAEWHGLIWPEQIGFRHACGSEYHVLTLLETLKARAQDNRETAVLFVDFYKAYDCVHPEAVLLVLTKMGVPARIVDLLRAWGQMRTVSVRVNGALSDPIDVETGVAQGDPLSPLLFNLFIQSLSGWLDSRQDLPGARLNSRALPGSPAAAYVLKRLLYADDLAMITAFPAMLQTALNHIKTWADAWGMRVNCNAGKTEAVLFSRDGKAARPAPMSYDGQAVNWVDSYVYLGRTLWHDMRGGAADLVGPVISNFALRFTYNNGMRRAAASSQLQVLKTSVLGAANYLRGIELLSRQDLERIDKYTKIAARLIIGLPSCASNTLTWALSGLMTARGTNAREIRRIWMQQYKTPHLNLESRKMALATTLYRTPWPRPKPGGAFVPDRLTSWVHAYTTTAGREIALGATMPEPVNYADIPRASSVFGRSVAYCEIQRIVRADMPPDGDVASLPPLSAGSGRHAGWLLCYMQASALELGEERQTPLSALGPGCSGSLHALADTALFPAVASAALGNEAMHMPPFADAQPKRERRSQRRRDRAEHGDDSDPEEDRDEAAARAAAFKARFVASPCVLCGAADASSIYHLITTCPHDSMRAARADLANTLPSTLRAIVRSCVDASGGEALVSRTASLAEAAALLGIIAPGGATPDNNDGRMITYRTLMGMPWPRRPMTRAGTFPAAAALGAVFDATTAAPSRLRKMASAWLAWSEAQLCSLARRWRQAQGLPPVALRRW